MRTKALLLTAAIGAVGLGTAMAQVYSVNVVGYVNTTLPVGFSIIANPLNNGNNTLNTILPTAPDGSRIYRFVSGTFDIVNREEDDFGNLNWEPNRTLNPGEAFFFQNRGASPIAATFVGEVPQGTLNNPLPSGFSLRASIVPQSAPLSGTAPGLGFPAQQGDIVWRLRPGTGTYDRFDYVEDDFGVLVWEPSNPTPNVGEGFWLKTTGARTWTRTFNVN